MFSYVETRAKIRPISPLYMHYITKLSQSQRLVLKIFCLRLRYKQFLSMKNRPLLQRSGLFRRLPYFLDFLNSFMPLVLPPSQSTSTPAR